MIRSEIGFFGRIVPAWAAAVTLFVPGLASGETLCAKIARQTTETVVAYDPPSSFTICRNGSVEQDIMVGRPVYVELVPDAGESLYRYRVHGSATDVEPTGLRRSAERLDALHGGLEEVLASGESVATNDASRPAPSDPVEVSRMLYLGVATERFHEALEAITGAVNDLPARAEELAHWCGEATTSSALPQVLASVLEQRCNDSSTAPAAVSKEASAFVSAIDDYRNARDAAREALVYARAKPDEATRARAVTAFDDARKKARDLVGLSHGLAPVAAALESKAWIVREAVLSRAGALQSGVPRYLSRFSQGGVATLQIDAAPVDLLPGSDQPTTSGAPKLETTQTFRFPVVSWHFLDLEVGIAALGGVPLVPSATTGGTVQGENVDEFAGLALVEFEPARLIWPDRPWGGLLRFPVIGVPFTRDPTRNFFGGAGLGWTDVGSICAGPYLLRELTLDAGHQLGETLAPGQTIASVTSPQLRVGYFVSASVDLAGLVHLFVRPREPALDATTGRETP